MKKIILLAAILISKTAAAQTNKLPITKPDTIYAAWNWPLLLGKYATGVLQNDTDPEKDSFYVTSFRIGKITSTYKANTLQYIKDSTGRIIANFTINSEGKVLFFSTVQDFTGILDFVYTVNDGKHSSGKTGKLTLIIYPSAENIINKPDYTKREP